MIPVVLVLYIRFLGFSESSSIVLYHAFSAVKGLSTSFIVDISADSDKFKIIVYTSVVYIIGGLVLTIGAIGDTSNGNQGIEGMPVR